MLKSLRMKDKISEHKEFSLSIEEFESITTTDFLAAGLVGDPSCYHPNIYIKRNSDEIVNFSIENFHENNARDHLYIYGSWGKGSGITRLIRRAAEVCRKLSLPYLYVDHINPHLYPRKTAERYKSRILEKLQELEGVKMVFFVDEARYHEIYDNALSIDGILVMGSGHMPRTELQNDIERFRIIDIDQSDAISTDDMYSILKAKLQIVVSGDEYPLTDEQLSYIAENSNVPGEAMDILDCLLKYYTIISKTNRRLSDDDIRFWTDVMHTQEYWEFIGPPSKRWSVFQIEYFDGKKINIERY